MEATVRRVMGSKANHGRWSALPWLVAVLAAPSVAWAECPTDLGAVRCGVIQVVRDNDPAETIPLDYVILESDDGSNIDPLFVLQGGPGQSATGQADYYAGAFAKIRERRSIYLVDIRGTGSSAWLSCPFSRAEGHLFPPVEVAACHRRLSATQPLDRVNTAQIADDLDRARRAFGLGQVHLYATSYGTRLALHWMARHPGSIATATLKGIAPWDEVLPSSHALNGQAAFNQLVLRCHQEPACATAYPNPDGELSQALRHVAARASGDPLSAGVFGELVRNELYHPGRSSGLFAKVRQALDGDWRYWEQAAAQYPIRAARELAMGNFLSIVCSEDTPYLDADNAAAINATFAGMFRMDEQRAACAVWPVPRVERALEDVPTLSTPVLLVSGDVDPVTPVQNGERALRSLPHGRHVVISNNGHSMGPAAPCVASMMEALMEANHTSGIDDSCKLALTSPPFVLPPE